MTFLPNKKSGDFNLMPGQESLKRVSLQIKKDTLDFLCKILHLYRKLSTPILEEIHFIVLEFSVVTSQGCLS